MSRRTAKRGIRKYTAYVPKTARATMNLGKKVIHGATSVLNGAVGVVRQSAKAVDKTTAKTIRSFTTGPRKKRRTTKHSRKHHKKQ